jgi:hypothetical protein
MFVQEIIVTASEDSCIVYFATVFANEIKTIQAPAKFVSAMIE